MRPIENIKLSFACKEDFNGMSPCSSGLHCRSCDKTVFDFRNQDLDKLTILLEEHGTVCGLFSKSQLQAKTNFKYIRKLVASALIAIGLGSFNSELFAQTKSCDNKDDNRVEDESLLLGQIVETLPTFKNGGDEGLKKFLRENLQYPSDYVQGKVFVNFTVDNNGNVVAPKILRGLSPAADKEVLRVVKLIKFIPGTQAGKKVSVSYTLPVNFSLYDEKIKKKRTK